MSEPTGMDPDAEQSLDIAVIGMAGRFPGAGSVLAYRELILDGASAVREFTADELATAGVGTDELRRPDHVAYGGVLDGAEYFDAAFFGYSPRDAAVLDPQQRVFLECAWHALEDAGHAGQPGSTIAGVFAGESISTYLLRHLLPNPARVTDLSEHELMLANDKDTLAARVAYHLDLRGPAVTVQTGCSTSLVAVHLAMQALLSRDCDIAIAGGVSIRLPQTAGYRHQPGGVMSTDGGCRPFDAGAQGTVGGNGVGVVVLRPLADALRDGDSVHAVIRGSAVNNDGSGRVGFTAPGIAGQAAVIRAAHQVAEVAPATVGYVEAHGTGTPLGDPIEVAALTEAFRTGAPQGQHWCALGSVKALIGHLDAAAGVAGLIKAILAVRDGVIPGNSYLSEPNPRLELSGSPFYLPTGGRQWQTTGHPRRAGVSSFGMGGTNAHVVLEQPPDRPGPRGAGSGPELLLLSARTTEALRTSARRLGEFLDSNQRLPLADVAHTLRAGRRQFAHRAALVCDRPAGAAQRLAAGELTASGVAATDEPKVVFLFPGQGSQHPGMARELYLHAPVFRRHFDACAEQLRPHLDRDLRDLLWGAGASAGERLSQTRNAQPALFAVEYALAQLWLHWGVRPHQMVGHSVGEYVAACLAGTIGLDDALTVVAARGRLIQSLPPGGMLSVALPADQATALARAEPELVLAASNAPRLSVLSGPTGAIDRLAADLAARGVVHRRLHTSHAFHSPMMDPALPQFGEVVGGIPLRAPDRRFIAGRTGAQITTDEATDPAYWVRHLREPVRFSEGLGTALAEGAGQLLLEVGPGTTLTTLARQHDLASGGHLAVGSLPHPGDPRTDLATALAAAGQVWAAGVAVDLRALGTGGRRVSLPGYPFARERHWIDLPAVTGPAPVPVTGQPTEPVSQPPVTGPAPAPVPPDPDPTEATIAAIWRQLLGVSTIGYRDNFFELGGHSLLATQILARIRESLDTDLPPDALFTAPTIGELAAEVRRRRGPAVGTADDQELSTLLDELAELPPAELRAELELVRQLPRGSES